MADEEANIAVAAMVIALVALLVTSGQLLQALFGTAVGYRHCQRSAIGGWVKWRNLKWHWREFRFETQFRTPHISLEAIDPSFVLPGPASQSYGDGLSFITGTSKSRIDTCIYEDDFHRDKEFLVGWLRLLEKLHVTINGCLCYQVSGDALKIAMDKISQPPLHQKEQTAESAQDNSAMSKVLNLDDAFAIDTQRAVRRQRSMCTSPAINYRRRSWDFMPPELTRPFASSNVGDIIAIAHRLGMGWTDLRPEEGIMRAEGRGLTITSTTVRGLGILLQFSNDNVSHPKFGLWEDLTIPCEWADALGFGIIVCRGVAHLHNMILDDEDDSVRTILSTLKMDREVIERFCDSIPQWGLQGLGDLISLVAPFMPIEGLTVRKIMKIHRDFCPNHFKEWEEFHAFELRLEQLYQRGECSEQMEHLRTEFRGMEATWGWVWTNQDRDPDSGNDVPIEYLDDLHTLWRDATFYLYDVYKDIRYGFFGDLIAAHIFQAIEDPEMVGKADRDQLKRKEFEEGLDKSRSWRTAARMHLYIDRIPMVVQFMKEKDYVDEKRVVDAWWTLIFRAMCWHRAHYMIEGKARGYGGIPVKSKFHNSKLPVYIV